MYVKIEFDTNEHPLTDEDRAFLRALSGETQTTVVVNQAFPTQSERHEAGSAQPSPEPEDEPEDEDEDEVVAEKKVKRGRRTRCKDCGELHYADEDCPEPEDDEPEDEPDEEDPIDRAVAIATRFVTEGRNAEVRKALKAAGAGRVSELKTKKAVQKFLDEIGE